MGEVIKLNTYKIEKQYKQYESMLINLALDNVRGKKVSKDFANNYQYALMKLRTDNLNRR